MAILKYPFGIISDIHCHAWNSFSHILETKVNSRLQEILDTIEEVVVAVRKAGGNDLIITGDLFHARGKLDPLVFNPTFDLFKKFSDDGLNVWFIPGNHDLAGKNSDTIGNVVHAFSALPNFKVFNAVTEMGDFVFVPWIEHKNDFVEVINEIKDPENKVLFCHIGIDGVLDGVTGKVGKAVFDKGFKYVFAGDYHNFKALGNGIYSVGALTHHSFGDINSRAGYLIVSEDEVKQFETDAPKFVNADGGKFKNNIVRLSGEYTEKDAKELVELIYAGGAKYVQDLTTRPTIKEASMSTTPIRVDLSIDVALEDYTKSKYGENYKAVLEEARRLRNEYV